MAQEQFRRSYRLDVGGTRIESKSDSQSFRIAFDVIRKSRAEPNRASVKIWNLNESSRSALEAAGSVSVKLDVGYQDSIRQIFFGALTKATSDHQGNEWITTIQGGDGADRLSAARVQASFAKGTPLVTVLAAFVKALGIPVGNLADAAATLGLGSLSHAAGFAGPAAEELTAFTRAEGLIWSIQDGAFQIQALDTPIPGTQGPKITPTTGLIGSPSVVVKGKKQGEVTGKALILPELIPGVPFRLESSRLTGDCVAVETRHYGDSTETDWYVDFKGKLLSGKKAK